MNKIITSLLAVALVAGFALPSFAATAKTCVFNDQSMCDTRSLSSDNVNDEGNS